MPPDIAAFFFSFFYLTNVCDCNLFFSFLIEYFLITVQVVGVTATSTMVQKYQSPVRVYKHPFELVMAVSVFAHIAGQLLTFRAIDPVYV